MPDITPPSDWRFVRIDARSIEVHCPTFSTPLVLSLDVQDRHLRSFYNLAADLVGAAAALQPCGHPASLLLKSAETGEPMYCEACDDKSGRRDAEQREQDYAVEINRLRNVIQAACTGGLGHMIERWKVLFPDAPVPSVQPTAETKDAARYRWLRDISTPPHNFYLSVPVEFDGVRYEPAEVDAGIDAAIAARSAAGSQT